MKRTAVYRHYNADGCLLYVGISISPIYRTAQHVKNSDWACDVTRIDLEWFDDRASAADAEAKAIKAERPLHNRAHNTHNAVTEIINIIGGGRIAAELGVTAHAVRHVKGAGAFPASWYRHLLSLCDEHDIDCPMTAFSWRSA